jgi:hypothetical protein
MQILSCPGENIVYISQLTCKKYAQMAADKRMQLFVRLEQIQEM